MTTILRLSAVKARTGLARSTLYDKLNPKSPHYDPAFPRPISLGARAVGWLESEIEDYLAKLVERSREAA